MPYEINITRSHSNQHNLKDVLLHNQELWVDIFRDHINDVSKYINKNQTPSFSIYRTPYDAMQASPMNDREDS
jgi:hypothetical protein